MQRTSVISISNVYYSSTWIEMFKSGINIEH